MKRLNLLLLLFLSTLCIAIVVISYFETVTQRIPVRERLADATEAEKIDAKRILFDERRHLQILMQRDFYITKDELFSAYKKSKLPKLIKKGFTKAEIVADEIPQIPEPAKPTKKNVYKQGFSNISNSWKGYGSAVNAIQALNAVSSKRNYQ